MNELFMELETTYWVESIMIKKRFTWKSEKLQHLNDEVLLVVDNTNKDWKGHILNVVDLLNQLHQENEQLRQFINKGRRLSVKELMDNVNENESLKKKIKKLEKENEQLRKELNDCEKFRYQIFKRIGALNDE